MKKNIFATLCLALVSGLMMAGCGNPGGEAGKSGSEAGKSGGETGNLSSEAGNSGSETGKSDSEAQNAAAQAAAELTVRFGDAGEPFTLHLYNNDTAAAIAKHVGTSNWRLPIYHYDDYDDWEVMQYYDIPSRYEIPSDPEQVTEEKAGAVYYSEPNRIILFYQDAEVSAEYTQVGYFDYTDEFLKAVQDNPVLEGWGNKIVQISDGE